MTFKLTLTDDQTEPVDQRPPLRAGTLIRHKMSDQFYLVTGTPVWVVCPYGSKNTGWSFQVWSLAFRYTTVGFWLVNDETPGWEIL